MKPCNLKTEIKYLNKRLTADGVTCQMTSYLPKITTGPHQVNTAENGGRGLKQLSPVGRQKLSLLELSQNVTHRREKVEGRFRAQSYDPSVQNRGKENRKRKSNVDRSKSLGHGDQEHTKARRKYVFDVNANVVSNRDVGDKRGSGHVSDEQGSADKKVRFNNGSEDSCENQETEGQQLTSQSNTRTINALGVQYKIKGEERNGVRLGTFSPVNVHTSSPKGPGRGSPSFQKRTRSPYSPRGSNRTRQNYSPPLASPRSTSDRSSPKGSPVSPRRGAAPGTHQSRLQAARTRARIWAETYSDPGPAPNDKVLK